MLLSTGAGPALGSISFARSQSATLAETAASSVIGWGANDDGQTAVPPGLSAVTALAAGASHSLALTSDGTVLAWGSNAAGQTDVPAGLHDVTAIAAGGFYSLALKADGRVIAWGDDGKAQQAVPSDLGSVTAVAAGADHSLALRADGTVVAWGGNDEFGQTDVPADLTGVTAIAAGFAHSLALKEDGTAVGWGGDGFGQADVPPGLSGVTAIAAGGGHSLALRTDGRVLAWGNDDFGQTEVPADLTGVTAIAAGAGHSLALTGDGKVVAWGADGSGQTDVPPELGKITSIGAGYWHSLAAIGSEVQAQPAPGSASAGAGLIQGSRQPLSIDGYQVQLSSVSIGPTFCLPSGMCVTPAGIQPGEQVLTIQLDVLSGDPEQFSTFDVWTSDQSGRRNGDKAALLKNNHITWLFSVAGAGRTFVLHFPSGAAVDLLPLMAGQTGAAPATAPAVATVAPASPDAAAPSVQPASTPLFSGDPRSVATSAADIAADAWIQVAENSVAPGDYQRVLASTGSRNTQVRVRVVVKSSVELADSEWKGQEANLTPGWQLVDAPSIADAQFTERTNGHLSVRARAKNVILILNLDSEDPSYSPYDMLVNLVRQMADRVNSQAGGNRSTVVTTAPGGAPEAIAAPTPTAVPSRAPSPTPPPPAATLQQPPTGTVIQDSRRNGDGELTISNRRDLDAEAVLTTPGGGVVVVAVYIRAGGSYTITGIRDGSYNLYFQQGQDWDPAAHRFTRDAQLYRFKDELSFSTSRAGNLTRYTTASVTLYGVAGGTAAVVPVDSGQFPTAP